MSATLIGRLRLKTSADIARLRQSMRTAAGRFGLDHFEQVQLATGISELGRLLVARGGGELVVSLATRRPQRLVIEVLSRDGEAFEERSAGTPELIAARRLLGGPADGEAAPGAVTFSRLLPPASAGAVDEVRAILEGGSKDPYEELVSQNQELLHVMEDLRERDAELTALNAELEETNRGVLALYSELDEKAESLRLAGEERSRFLSNVTHELRTPLSSILALCRLLLAGEAARLDGEQKTQIKYIQKSAQDLYDFVSDLLDLAKFEAGKTQVHVAEFTINDLFAALRGMFRPLAIDPHVVLRFQHGRFPPLQTDEGKVAQILRNLISNALKFTENGEVIVSASYSAEDATAVFEVSDTGSGIAAEDLERIFDEFSQVDGRTTRRERGSGLGLPLSRTLASLLGGTLTAHSSVGAGSTFTLRIPTVYRDPATLVPGSAPTVLVVDDDQISRYVVREQLERLGWRVLEASSGETALSLLQEGAAAAMVLDLLMPGMSGFEILDRLRKQPHKEIPIAIRTSVPIQQIDPAAVRGTVGVFSKDDNSLERLVKALIGGLKATADAVPAERPAPSVGNA